MYKFLVYLFVLSIYIYIPVWSQEKKETYTELSHPYGDETVTDCNMKDSSTNLAICSDDEDDEDQLVGKCPINLKQEGFFNPYTKCSDTLYAPENELIFSTTSIALPEVQCKKCDLRLTQDGQGVIVECFSCFEIPKSGPASRIEKDVIYKAYYVQVANYTTVEVAGQENF